MKKCKEKMLTGTGLLLIAAALFLCAGNFRESESAAASARNAARELQEQSLSAKPDTGISPPETEAPEEMAVKIIDGREYIGTLSIPVLELELGILSRCTDAGLKLAPGRFTGNASSEDLVIAAHNYASHFGRLGQLQPGDDVILTGVTGEIYRYRVAEKEILPPDAVTEMTESCWPLTLFTCTLGGEERLTVRCEAVQTQGMAMYRN